VGTRPIRAIRICARRHHNDDGWISRLCHHRDEPRPCVAASLTWDGLPSFRQRYEGDRQRYLRYPDISVTCRPIDDKDDRMLEPILIIEVISPSTEHRARRSRLQEIRLLRNPVGPAIRHHRAGRAADRSLHPRRRPLDRRSRRGRRGPQPFVYRRRGEPRYDLRGYRARCYSAARGRATISGGVNERSCCSEGTMRRTSATRAASIRATEIPAPSPPSASTSPQGSTISE
jgi:hypothetical protein